VTAKIGVIGGTGLYDMPGIEVVREHELDTPFGRPSDTIVEAAFKGKTLFFLPRHGRGHRISPSEVNYRANIFALKTLGVERIISISAVGSMREEIAPGHVVIVDQFLDRTLGRPRTFFGDGIVGHVGFADPICSDLAGALHDAAVEVGATVHRGGTYICIEGPQFSTRAESNTFRAWGVSVIGMTNLPEARLAREAEICYATVALATDYDCWHEEEDDVSVESVIAVLKKNVRTAQKIIAAAVERIDGERSCACKDALAWAIITDRARIPEETRKKLWPLIGRHLKEEE